MPIYNVLQTSGILHVFHNRDSLPDINDYSFGDMVLLYNQKQMYVLAPNRTWEHVGEIEMDTNSEEYNNIKINTESKAEIEENINPSWDALLTGEQLCLEN